ncbi:MAG: hypothetical protein Q8L87_00535 [Anaerolineales bacterium]|jgi:hypothetical protein|nr:hypothetical protein [Anaerolineales bacterium]
MMSIPQILEVVIGLIFIYYILGSVVSLITQWINEGLETRGKALERYLIKIVGDKKVGDLVSLPQLQSLRPIRYKNFMSVFTSATEPKKIEKVPVATLVDAYFDLAGFTANTQVNAEQLTALINNLPDSDGKQAFVQWVNQGVTNLEDLRKRTTAYFSGLMEQASATFRSNARSFVITLSIIITLLLGADSIQLVRTLWVNAELRTLAAAKAEMVVQQEGLDATVTDLLQELSDLTLNFGWWRTELPEAGTSAMGWVYFVILKLLGLGLTAAAISQGSSFWYDLLKKISSPTSSSSSSTSSRGGSSSSSSSASG